MTTPPKGKVSSYRLTKNGHLLQIDFSFWNVTSVHGFSSLLSVIDGKDHMLWVFPTASKYLPVDLLNFIFTMLEREGVTILCICVDEDGALLNSTKFTTFLTNRTFTMETTGGYASFLNGKVERPHRTIANMVRAMFLNAGLNRNLWCYDAETAADVYCYTYHSAFMYDSLEGLVWYSASC
jgi:hypothetical protein